jgi:acyl-coenzyme A thioesterase PaaI-like protein
MAYELIRQQLSKTVPFARHAGVEIDKIEKDGAIAHLPFRPEGLNRVGTQHAAALFALGEAASGAAMAGAFAPILLEIKPVAAQASIKFMGVAKGSVRAEAIVTGDADDLVRSVRTEGRAKFPITVALIAEDHTKVGEMIVDWHVSLKR